VYQVDYQKAAAAALLALAGDHGGARCVVGGSSPLASAAEQAKKRESLLEFGVTMIERRQADFSMYLAVISGLYLLLAGPAVGAFYYSTMTNGAVTTTGTRANANNHELVLLHANRQISNEGVSSVGETRPGDSDVHYKDVKGIIFDIDGTLADSWKLGYDSTASVLKANGILPISEEEYHRCTRYSTPERLARHAGFLPGDEQFDTVGAKLAQEFDDLYVGLVTTETAGFYEDVASFLQEIPSHVALGALTNAAVRYAEAVLEANCPVSSRRQEEGGIHCRFQSIRGADNVPEPKPSPSGLLQVCDDLGLSPGQCVYVGDSPTDALAAEAACMPAIGVLWGSHSEESLRMAPFRHICRTVEELQNLLPR